MKKFLSIMGILIFLPSIFAQVGINTDSPNQNSILHASESENGSVDGTPSIYKGVIVPRYTDAERDGSFGVLSNEDNSLLIYNTDTDCYNYWSAQASSWMEICGTPVGSVESEADVNCAGAVVSTPVTQGTSATGTTVTIPYTNGNGGAYASQSYSSTGVTGLTASLPAGNFSTGSGNLIFNLSGTPTTTGTASFSLNMGGTTCTFNVTVGVGIGIAVIDCPSSVTTGTLTEGTAASGVSVNIPYTSGNGGSYTAQNLTSTGVTGLTATIPAGNFASGPGNLVFTISGTPTSSGQAGFTLNMGATTCTFYVDVDDSTPQPAEFSSCSTVVQGNYIVKTPLTSANKIVVTLNVTQPGIIKLVSQDKNGIKFESAEVTLATGSQQVTMNSVTATSGTYPMTSEETSNGSNGGNNQKGTYTITNTVTGSTICPATLDVKPLRINGTRVSSIQRTIGNLSGGASYGNGFISSSSLSNSLASDGIISPDLSPKASGEYRFWNSHIRNVSGSSIVVDFATKSSTAEDVPYLPYSWSGLTISSGSTIGSIDPFAQSSNPPTTSLDYGAYGGGDLWAELNDVGVLVQYQGKWYKYRMILKLYRIGSTYANDFQTFLVLYGIYNTKPSIYMPDTPSNTTGAGSDISFDVQSYWP